MIAEKGIMIYVLRGGYKPCDEDCLEPNFGWLAQVFSFMGCRSTGRYLKKQLLSAFSFAYIPIIVFSFKISNKLNLRD